MPLQNFEEFCLHLLSDGMGLTVEKIFDSAADAAKEGLKKHAIDAAIKGADELDDTGALRKRIRTCMMTSLKAIEGHLHVLRNRDVIDAATFLESGIGKLMLPPAPDANRNDFRRQEVGDDFRKAREAAIKSMSVLPDVTSRVHATKLRIASSMYLYHEVNRDIDMAAEEAKQAVQCLLDQAAVRELVANHFGGETWRAVVRTVRFAFEGQSNEHHTLAELRLLCHQVVTWHRQHELRLPSWHVRACEATIDPLHKFPKDLIRTPCIGTHAGHTDHVESLVLSLKAGRLYSGSKDNTIKVWDVENMTCITTPTDHCVTSLYFLADRGRLYSGSFATIRVWDVESMACIRTLELEGCTGYVKSLVCDARRLYSGWDDKFKSIKVWDVESMCFICPLKGHDGTVVSLVCHADRLYSGSWDRTIKIWDVQDSHKMFCICTLAEHTDTIWSLVIDDAAGLLYSGSRDTTIKVWKQKDAQDFRSMTCIGTLQGHAKMVVSLVLNAGCLYSGSKDGSIKVWDVQDDQNMTCIGTLKGHTDRVQSLVVNAGRLYSGSHDKTIKVWSAEPSKFWDAEPISVSVERK